MKIKITFTKIKNTSPIWCLNTELLEDKNYCELIEELWTQWKNKKTNFPKIQDWWDIGKNKIKWLTQQYSTQKHRSFKSSKENLERELKEIEHMISDTTHTDPNLINDYNDKKQILKTYIRTESKGAAVRARQQLLHESDASTDFFSSLEKQKNSRKILTQLRRSDQSITTDQTEIRKLTHSFYQNLFTPDPISTSEQNKLLANLPKLDKDKSDYCDTDISLEELTHAVKQLSNNRSPGIDGIPNEFYKKFWPIINQDFLEVLQTCIKDGELPQSSRRAIISLIPKKGDNTLLKNWRPVSLLCSDYKIFTKCLSLHLRNVIGSIIHIDQTCSIPGRCIEDNINLIRDCTHYSNDT